MLRRSIATKICLTANSYPGVRNNHTTIALITPVSLPKHCSSKYLKLSLPLTKWRTPRVFMISCSRRCHEVTEQVRRTDICSWHSHWYWYWYWYSHWYWYWYCYWYWHWPWYLIYLILILILLLILILTMISDTPDTNSDISVGFAVPPSRYSLTCTLCYWFIEPYSDDHWQCQWKGCGRDSRYCG